MDYAWTEPKHDPIATDTNLAEIDFEDFRNEDLAYAFSCVSTENRFQFAGHPSPHLRHFESSALTVSR